MKKYIKPVMEVTEVEVGVILAGSGTPSTTPSSDEIIDDAMMFLPVQATAVFGINSPYLSL